MAKLVWDQPGKRFYETGTDRGVIYPILDTISDQTRPYDKGVAWNGLTGVSESASGGEPSPMWADNIKYLNLVATEEANLTIEAYTYPEEFEQCDGSREIATGVSIGQQPRKQFGFSYRTLIGNDQKSNDYGYKIHLVYGCFASPSDKSYQTVNDSPEAITFSWSVSTTPVDVTGFKPTATLTIDSTKTDTAKLAALETILYGRDAGDNVEAVDPRLPLPNEVMTLVGGTANSNAGGNAGGNS